MWWTEKLRDRGSGTYTCNSFVAVFLAVVMVTTAPFPLPQYSKRRAHLGRAAGKGSQQLSFCDGVLLWQACFQRSLPYVFIRL